MQLHGKNFIAGNLSAEGTKTFSAANPVTGEKLDCFHEGTKTEVERAFAAAEQAAEQLRDVPAQKIAEFLDTIAAELLALDDNLIRRAQLETALPEARLVGERGRTVNQLKMFADLVREGSWVEATIDRAMPDRKPLPKPDLRRMLIPLGPVVVFGASNFPLAFSVPGGDTASALAAKNPVIVKAHPAHPGTSELCATAISNAVKKCNLPSGTFSLVHGTSHDIGLQLVKHRAAAAVGFTGSLKGGRALFDAAAARPNPIPVYAEMGSTNPVFVLPGALEKNASGIAEGLVQSVAMGVGQFCTNPGLVVGLAGSQLSQFIDSAAKAAANVAPGTMLYDAICQRYRDSVQHLKSLPDVHVITQEAAATDSKKAQTIVFTTSAKTFLKEKQLQEEVFGPSTIIVTCDSERELEEVARNMEGQLTATIHGTEDDLARNKKLVSLLQQKVGRLLFNGFPTGVEVCPSMHHGGPYPATTDARSTSVGTAAIKRFARPICLQNFPDSQLPVELQNKNERNILRLVDNQWSRENL